MSPLFWNLDFFHVWEGRDHQSLFLVTWALLFHGSCVLALHRHLSFCFSLDIMAQFHDLLVDRIVDELYADLSAFLLLSVYDIQWRHVSRVHKYSERLTQAVSNSCAAVFKSDRGFGDIPELDQILKWWHFRLSEMIFRRVVALNDEIPSKLVIHQVYN